MKYIRTKDGVYRVMISNILFSGLNRIDKRDGTYPDINKQETIAQANTIEELGDVYIIVPKDSKSKPYTVNTLSMFDDIEDVLRHNDIYLSIWVGALLKPAAKMNDKGELELL